MSQQSVQLLTGLHNSRWFTEIMCGLGEVNRSVMVRELDAVG